MSHGQSTDGDGTAHEPAEAADEVVTSFAAELARLRELHGSPSFARMHASIRHNGRAAGSKNTFHRMVSNPDRIYEPEFVRGFVLALGLDDGEASVWEQRRMLALRDYQAQRDAASSQGRDGGRAHSRRRLALAAVTISAAVVVTVVSATLVGGGNPASSSTHALSRDPATQGGMPAAADGADPKDSGCSLDPAVTTLDSAEVDYQGLPVGLDELRYSPRCGVAWARFDPFRGAKIPAGAMIHVNVYRPGAKVSEEAFQGRYVGQAVYGNVLQSTARCVYAGVTIEDAGRELPPSRTRCFRGATPQWDAGTARR